MDQLGHYGREDGNELFITKALRQKVNGGGSNILTFPLNIQVARDNGPPLLVGPPNTYLNFSQRLMRIDVQESVVNYHLKQLPKRATMISSTRGFNTSHLLEYNKYTISCGYR